MEGAHQTPIVVPHVEWTKSFAREGAPEPEPKTPARRRRDTNDENPTEAEMDDQAPGDARRTLANSRHTQFPRRSPRLTTTRPKVRPNAAAAKKLQDDRPAKFSKYPDLYHELKLMVWNCVKEQEARAVYIRNSSVATFEPIVQTPPPIWPEIDESSEQVANLAYLQMFVVCGPDGRPDDRTRQLVNPSVDVIVLEPCNGECRGGNCVRSQYSAADRAKVRFLAVGSGWRAPWERLSKIFPNIEVLYLLRNPLMGNKREQYALIRVLPDPREVELQLRFSEWKEKAGKDNPLASLQYAFVTLKEPLPKRPAGPTNTPIKKESGQRYQCVQERLTGTDKDIIVG
ncbi:hypothetical protein LQW54_002344 [Pestalotiopsis sp. IQ-011]